ncbi:MAG: hypothetical protein AABX47_01560 [Nanoarchaeota archaeon]
MRNWLPIMIALIVCSSAVITSCAKEPQTRILSESEVKALGVEPIADTEPAAPKATAKEKNQTKQPEITDQSGQEIPSEETQAAPSSEKNKTSSDENNSTSETYPAEPAQKQRELTHRPKRKDGAELLYKPTSPASAQNPAFSPDGKEILFTLFHNGYNEGPAGLYKIDIETGEVTKIFEEPNQDAVNLPGSSWNKNGRIAFSSDRQGRESIWTVGADGKDPLRASSPPSGKYHIEPSMSPDGKWVVYEENNDTEEIGKRGMIYKELIGGGERKNLTDGPGKGYDDRQPNWSPKGDRIAYQRRVGNSDEWNIYTVDTEGGDEKTVTTYGEDTDASWSSDGERIVYSSTDGGLDSPSIFTIPADGGSPTRVTEQKGDSDSAPSYSPDNRRIAFESHRADNEESPASIWIIEA